jgi:TatD DNase family protein
MAGLHPTSVNKAFDKEFNSVEQELKRGIYYGIGEIGIDLYWDTTFRDEQEEVFKRQLQLAKKHKLPVSIHTRNSFDIVINIVKRELTGDLRGVFHCFSGNTEEAKEIMDTGFKMGIGGILTFKNSGLDKVVKGIPLNHLVLETDSPYLTPVPFRGKRNESSYLTYIAGKLAEIKDVTAEEIAEKTTNNASELFNIIIK